jgi:hypothetical protein
LTSCAGTTKNTCSLAYGCNLCFPPGAPTKMFTYSSGWRRTPAGTTIGLRCGLCSLCPLCSLLLTLRGKRRTSRFEFIGSQLVLCADECRSGRPGQPCALHNAVLVGCCEFGVGLR